MKSYNFRVQGPDPETAFQVSAGAVVVTGSDQDGTPLSVLLPTGQVWPGRSALTTLSDTFVPVDAWLIGAGAATTPVPPGVSATEATDLIRVQLLRTGPVAARLRRLHALTGTLCINHEDIGLAVGITRETVTNALGKLRDTHPDLFTR